MATNRDTAEIDADYVIRRLEEAGATLIALPANIPKLGANVQTYGYVAEMASDWKASKRLSPPVPSAAYISRMDETFGWLSYVPNVALRRVVAARSLTRPVSGEHIVSWLRLAAILGCDRRTLPGWHDKAINMIVHRLIEIGHFPVNMR